jgi:hypothetical protein
MLPPVPPVSTIAPIVIISEHPVLWSPSLCSFPPPPYNHTPPSIP